MVTDAVVTAAMSTVGALLNLIPAMQFDSMASSVTSLWSWIQPYWDVADYMGPAHEAALLLGGLWMLDLSGVLVGAVLRIWRLLPVLGHGVA